MSVFAVGSVVEGQGDDRPLGDLDALAPGIGRLAVRLGRSLRGGLGRLGGLLGGGRRRGSIRRLGRLRGRRRRASRWAESISGVTVGPGVASEKVSGPPRRAPPCQG